MMSTTPINVKHKTVFALLTTALVVMGLAGSASAAPESEGLPPERSFMSTVIDNVPVPYDVLVYAQMKYQGHAITNVRQITTHDGKQLYKLRVDNDDKLNDYKSSFLIYDLGWNLVDQEKMTPPPTPKVIPKNEEKPVDKKPENDKKEIKDPNHERKNQGSTTERQDDTEEEQEEESAAGTGSEGDDSDTTEENTGSGSV